jgi:translation initiation factor IF-3
MIRIPQVRVVDEEGNQLGVMPTPRALEMAQERGYDLVEVAPMASPPVVRFLDFGQYKYELTKREKEAKRKQRALGFKEVRLSPKIGQGDFDTKVHRAIEFLEDGDRIKVTVRFRGRELTHPELGRNLLTKFTEQIKEHGVVERAPLLEGKSMHLTVASLHKPRAQEAAARGQAERSQGERPQGERPQDADRAQGTEAAPAPAAKPASGNQRAAADQPAANQRAAADQPAENEPAAGSQPTAGNQPATTSQPAQPAAATAGAGQTQTNQPAAPASTGE